MIYFDNASTSFPKPPLVAGAVAAAINSFTVPNRGVYPTALAASRALYECRTAVADLFHANDPSAVVFASGATEALNLAINGLLTPSDHVITTVTEHNAVLRTLYRLRCPLDIVPCDPYGRLLTDGMHKRLRPTTRAVVCCHISNVTGNVADVAFFSRFCRENGLYFIVDCAQSAGNTSVNANLADVICFTGHKALFGPQGTGGMVVNGAPVRPFKTGGTGHHSAERHQPHALPDRLEAGTHNGHGLAGLLAGIHFIKETGFQTIITREESLVRRFVEGVSTIKKIKIYGDIHQPGRSAVLSLSVDGYGSDEVSAMLADEYGIATRPGLHCAPLIHQALGTEKTGLTRFSFSYFNTMDEIDTAIQALASL